MIARHPYRPLLLEFGKMLVKQPVAERRRLVKITGSNLIVP